MLLAVTIGYAQIPQTISYQGVLTDSTGSFVPDGAYGITFQLYESATGGVPLWNEIQTVSVVDGIFSVLLGGIVPIQLDFAEPYWLGIAIGIDPELIPRIELTTSAYAFRSAVTDNADSLNGQAGNFYRDWDNLQNVPPGFADGSDDGGSILYEAVVAADGSGDYTSVADAISDGKKSIFIRNGVYTLPGDLSLPDSTLLLGENRNNVVFTGNGRFVGGSSVTLKRFSINNVYTQAVNMSGSGNRFIELTIVTTGTMAISSGNYSHVNDCEIYNNGYPIYLGHHSTVQNCVLDGGSGCRCEIGHHSIMMCNEIRKSGGTNYAAVYAAANCKISDNFIVNSTTQSVGIYIPEGCSVIGNTIEQFSTGIVVYDTEGEYVIIGNIVRNCGGTAYSLNASNTQNYMEIIGNVAFNPGGYGFDLQGGFRVILSGNQVYSGGSDGFYANMGVVEELVISNNTARNCAGIGFNLSGGSWSHSKWSIVGNQADENGSDGFRIYASDAAISGNVSTWNAGDGFGFPNELRFSSFTGNIASYNTGNGFFASGSISQCTIGNNVIRDPFYISGQLSSSTLTSNVLTGGVTSYGSPQTNSIIANNVE